MKSEISMQKEKQYIVLVYDGDVEDILIFFIRRAFTQKDARAQVVKYYKAQDWGTKVPHMRVLRIASNTINYLGKAQVRELPVPAQSEEPKYTPEIEWV